MEKKDSMDYREIEQILSEGLVASMSGLECPMAMLRTKGQVPRRSKPVPDGEAGW